MTSVAVSRHSLAWLACLIALAGAPAARALDSPVDPPGRVARLSLIEGEVSFAPAGTDEWAEAVLNRPLTSEDRLSVGVDGRAEVQVGSATVHLNRNAQFGFIELDDDVMQMSLVDGAATIRVRRLADGETVKIETPNATVRLRGEGEYHVEVNPDSDQTIVKTRSGAADVMGGSQSYTVRANEQGVFSGLENLTAQTGPIAERTPFEAWANDRNGREEQSESSRYVSHDVVGYQDLDNQGDWVHEREYGYVWRPLYVSAGWAPYRYGRWAWISPWGWSWIDDAPWGYAPFHYGRWVNLHQRWCWVPGPRHLRPIYAPALVGWMGGPSVSASIAYGPGVGWYPLGPREVYWPGYRHTPRYVRNVNVSNTVVSNHYITNVYSRPRRHEDHRYRQEEHRYRRYPDAITAVQRDHFVSGRQIGGYRVRLNDRDVREWRDDPRPPAIAPYRESVLAGQPRERRPDRFTNRDRDWLARRGGAGRVDFTAERRAIENNGGRPISRSQLIDNPKERGDYRVSQPSDIKRHLIEQRQQNERGASTSINRPTPRGAPQHADQQQQRIPAERADNERVEILRAQSETQAIRQRSDSTPREPQQQQRIPAERAGDERVEIIRGHENQSMRQRSDSTPREAQQQRYAPPTRALQTAPAQRDDGARYGSDSSRERSSSGRSMRETPQGGASSSPAPRSFTPAPQAPERQHTEQPRQAERSGNRSGSASQDRGNSSRDRGNSRFQPP
jgi:hypothetical protein